MRARGVHRQAVARRQRRHLALGGVGAEDAQSRARGSRPSVTFSATVSVSTSMKCWCTMPSPRAHRVRAGCAKRTARPSTSIAPASGASSP